MGRLNGKVAVITGATSGIGLRTAEVFVAEGAKIVVAGRRAPEGEALAAKLGPNCIFRQTDVTVEDQMQALIGQAVEKFGRIDCLFNNAGGPAQTGGIEGLDVARFDAAMATLLRSVMLGMKHAAPHMRHQGSGSIINNGSIAGRLAGFSSSVVYGAAKAAVIHLTKCVAMELGESGIRVNSISPGAIATGIFGKALGLSVDAAEKTPEVMREIYKTAQPIQRALAQTPRRCAASINPASSTVVIRWSTAHTAAALDRAAAGGVAMRTRSITRVEIRMSAFEINAGAEARPLCVAVIAGLAGRFADRQQALDFAIAHLGPSSRYVERPPAFHTVEPIASRLRAGARHHRAGILRPWRIYPRARHRGPQVTAYVTKGESSAARLCPRCKQF